jgi:hypothetical protein
MDPHALRAQLVQDLNLKDIPESTQNEIIDQLGQNVMRRVTMEILKKIPENKYDEFDQISRTGDVTQIQNYIAQYIPDTDAFIREKTKETVDEFKSLANLA